jgi:pyruvate kinase
MTPTVAAQSVKRVLNSTEPRSFDPHRAMTGGMRKTKIVSTIGPTSNTKDVFFKLADCGINVVRLNMSHGDHNSHMDVVKLVREYNAVRDNNLAIMLDTKGPEIRSGDVVKPLQLETGDTLIFTIDEASAGGGDNRVSVNYDGFISDCSVSDIVLVDGGLLSMEVKEISGSDLICTVIDGGSMGSRRHLNVRGKSANLPAITEKDWDDIKFGIQAGVDYFALSFVRDADVIHELRRYLIEEAGQDEDSRIQILAKIESADSVNHLEEILDAVDGAMVARGDLGAELPVEEVPYWQNRIVQGCRARGKPCIVATNMLESMIQHPAPTRAEVTDIAVAVREGTDAVMLSGETAYGNFPLKSVELMSTVCCQTEQAMQQETNVDIEPLSLLLGSSPSPGFSPKRKLIGSGSTRQVAADKLSEVIAFHAADMSDTLQCPLVVFSRHGTMPKLLSNVRPDSMIFCFTDSKSVQRRLALYHSIMCFHIEFLEEAEDTYDLAVTMLRERGYVDENQALVVVQGGQDPIWKTRSPYAAQIRRVS